MFVVRQANNIGGDLFIFNKYILYLFYLLHLPIIFLPESLIFSDRRRGRCCLSGNLFTVRHVVFYYDYGSKKETRHNNNCIKNLATASETCNQSRLSLLSIGQLNLMVSNQSPGDRSFDSDWILLNFYKIKIVYQRGESILQSSGMIFIGKLVGRVSGSWTDLVLVELQ